jgi:anti-sigma regulatory factor (Ser/Thr protein kinase)
VREWHTDVAVVPDVRVPDNRVGHADRVGFRHEAWPYSGDAEFVECAAAFVDDGVRAGEAVVVVVSGTKIEQLRAAVGGDAPCVAYADMAEVGHNPARIIPAWRRFLGAHDTMRAVRGIGEPIHAGRSGDELVECHVHEALLNRAFADSVRDFWLVCPYDTSAVAPEVVDEARHTHPHVANGHGASEPGAFDRERGVDEVLRLPLSPVPSEAIVHAFEGDDLCDVRAVASGFATRAGLGSERVDDFVLGVHEVAANSVRHGPGRGVLSLWRRPDRLMAEVHDPGSIADPLVGRAEPDLDACSGRGLWIANQLFDLVQIRSNGTGAVVRMQYVIR